MKKFLLATMALAVVAVVGLGFAGAYSGVRTLAPGVRTWAPGVRTWADGGVRTWA